MWWGPKSALALTWLLALTHARCMVDIFLEPSNWNVYYAEEGGPISIECIVIADKGIEVNVTWSGRSINPFKPQNVSYVLRRTYQRVGNWLNITHFSYRTAGRYKCKAKTQFRCRSSTRKIWVVKKRNTSKERGGSRKTEKTMKRGGSRRTEKTLTPGGVDKPTWIITGSDESIETTKNSGERSSASNDKGIGRFISAVIGAVIGALISVVVTFVLVGFWCFRKKKKKGSKKVAYKDRNIIFGEDEQLTYELKNQCGTNMADDSDADDQGPANDHLESCRTSIRSSGDEMIDEERFWASQGNHEAELSLTGEDGLHLRLINCLKNPGHHNFIPVNEFNIEHLPSHYHDKLIVDYVRATSDVTCRLSVLRISEDRPTIWPDSDKTSLFSTDKEKESIKTGVTEDRPETYPDNDQASLLSSYKRNNCVMTGTGWVNDVIKFSSIDNVYCECEECHKPPTHKPKKTWGVVYLRTACHVVYNDEEAKHTTCQFFYDSHDTDINKVLTFTGLKVVRSDIKRDLCWLMYVTHDVELLETFDKMCIRLRNLHHKVITKYRYMLKKSSDAMCDTSIKHDLCIVVSHPHGCGKTITVGKWTQKHLVRKDGSGNEEIRYSYNTPTCPGSGGAPVITLVNDMRSQCGLSHPRANRQGLPGGQEDNMNCTMEAAVNKTIILCKKNPGHQKFICVQDFKIKHLPIRYRDNFIVNYVEGTSHLTCRLSVRDISEDRPETLAGSEQVTSGTGWVTNVVKFTDGENGDCPCKECCKTGEETPETTWGIVYLKTASHVVHSDEAARDTKFHFFYDSHEATLTTVPTLTGSEVKERSIDGDSCVMISVTHDVSLLDTLYKKSVEWLKQRSKVHYKYLHSKSLGTGRDNDVKHDLCVIVSHPHGCSKAVSVGKWTQKHLVRKDDSGNEEIKYSYDTPTCPGSSGAPVILIVDGIKLQCELSLLPPHSEGRPGNDNNSGVIVE